MTFGLPQETLAWAVLVIGLGALAAGALRADRVARAASDRPRLTLALLALGAALLSAGYLYHYLRGGPRIIDATSYYLEARAMARGYLAFPVPDPSGSFRGRFLLTPPAQASLAVLFPPGYPALLALGFVVGAPLAVGPVLAAALTWVTYALARELFGKTEVALLAATLSVLCAALRYHTADTMSHGWAALLLCLALLGALKGGRWLLVAGLALGFLIATRPVTGLTAGAFAGLLCLRRRRAELLVLGLGALPGLMLLLAHQHAATGSWLGSTQLRYYALADGPPGCFRYGFGAGIGCVFEHGDFVQSRLSEGYGLVAALGTTGRRLWMHFGDVMNAWPLFAVVVATLVVGRHERGVRLGAFVVVALIAAYAPFYFDGNYPGGGARLLAEALPIEHALTAWGLVRLRIGRFAPGAMCLAFGLHGHRAHEALRDREGGRPMFEATVLEAAGVDHGLVFVNTDHGFNLGHVPGARDRVVARFRGDAHDTWLWNALGRPPAYRYVFDASPRPEPPRVERYVPTEIASVEAGAEWPPLEVRRGYAHPDYPGAACAEGRYGLRLRDAEVELELMAAAGGAHQIVPRWVIDRDGPVEVELEAEGVRWAARWDGRAGECADTPGPLISLREGVFRVKISGRGGGLVLGSLAARSTPAAGASRKGVDN
ncbi:MAG: glycosyltransferase family 39 protein [Polyangiaceae bacterium]|nr:glycosyltransferase family 39 protein [Polyangiaceae bacterium]